MYYCHLDGLDCDHDVCDDRVYSKPHLMAVVNVDVPVEQFDVATNTIDRRNWTVDMAVLRDCDSRVRNVLNDRHQFDHNYSVDLIHNIVISKEHVIMVTFAVNWLMYSCVNCCVDAYHRAIQFDRMHNLYLLSNLSMLNLVLIYPAEMRKRNTEKTNGKIQMIDKWKQNEFRMTTHYKIQKRNKRQMFNEFSM